MFSKEDIEQMQQKGISEAQIEAQLESFRKGFDYLKLQGAASIGGGIMVRACQRSRKPYVQEYVRVPRCRL